MHDKTKLRYLRLWKFVPILLFFLFSAVVVSAQDTVKGVVLDSKGVGLPGVSVSVIGKGRGVATNSEGYYIIQAVKGDKIQFSAVGFNAQEVVVGNNLEINITLTQAASQAMDEVVVVGYGTRKRSDVTGSVASVPKERLSKLPVNNVLQAVQGAVANVTVSQASSIPGDAPSAQIRGRNSINASSEPYVVVDGIPLSRTDGSINDINPNDIESMEILKDPSAVAIYGVNGSNGVILITTKRGASGKPLIFGVLKCQGKVYTEIVLKQHCKPLFVGM